MSQKEFEDDPYTLSAAGDLPCLTLNDVEGHLAKARLVERLVERERCAKIAEESGCSLCHTICSSTIARRIREGG